MLIDAANQYAAAQLETHAHYAEAVGLTVLQQTIQQLQQRLQEAQSTPNTCLLCLGWGSGFLSKTAFLNTDNSSYRKILRTVPAISNAIREGVPFPKTRRIVFSGGQPTFLPGWTALQIQNA
jgi:CRISPR-associated protein Csm5